MAGGTYPDTLSGRDLTPLEGIRFLPLLEGRQLEQETHEALFWEHLGYYAVRHGNWILVAAGGEWKLYDLENDRTELNNLAIKDPEKVAELEAMWNEWAKRAMVTD